MFRNYSLLGTALITMLCASSAMSKDLYVAVNGNNSVSYAENSKDNPWATITHGVYNIKAGDTLHIRGGTYTPTHTMRLRSDYDNRTYGGDPSEKMNAESGTENAPVAITGFDGERVVIDLRNVGTFARVEYKNYWTFKDLELINAGTAFSVGVNGPAYHNNFDNLKVTMSKGGDNGAAIKINGKTADYASITNSILIGPGTGPEIHLNTGTIFARQVRNLKIKNNKLSNAPFGIYYKHATVEGDGDIDIEIAYNYISDTSRASMELNSNGAHIHNNIIGLNNRGVSVNVSNGGPGGDNNIFEYNTFYGGGLSLRWDTQAGDPLPGAINNTVRNNIFVGDFRLHHYSNKPHNTTTDYNVFSAEEADISENRIQYSLGEWADFHGQDGSSLTGTVDFVGSAMNKVTDYEIRSGSLGYLKSSHGKNIGANAALVGPRTAQIKAVASPVRNVKLK